MNKLEKMDEQDNNQETNQQIDLIIQGLKDLHHKFAVSRQVLESQINGDKSPEDGKPHDQKNDGPSNIDSFKDPYIL